MDRHEHTPEELAALELYHQLVNLSPDDGDRALMITLRLPNGRYVGDVWLSKQDVTDLADASVGLAAVRDYEQANPLPNPDSDVLAQALTQLENLANGDL
ncbi:hypothetical protein ACF060_31455 [Streptomyces werraensis]|uniref:hypothetical protein n=1 Tax=Streptomyces werraensis TaxID=68284 RepID=UPI0036FF34A5